MSSDCTLRYVFEVGEEKAIGVSVDSNAILRSIADAIATAFKEGVLHTLRSHVKPGSEAERLEAELALYRAELREIEAEQERIVDAVAGGDFRRGMAKKLNARYETAITKAAQTRQRIDVTELELAAAQREQAGRDANEQVASILDIVNALRDPHSMKARRFLRGSIEQLHFNVPDGSTARTNTSWEGSLLLGVGKERTRLQFHGTTDGTRVPGKALSAVATEMLQGATLRRAHLRSASTARILALADEPGLSPGERWIPRVNNGLLLQAYLAEYSRHPHAPKWREIGPKLAEVFGDVDALRKAIRITHARLEAQAPHPVWKALAHSERETEALIASTGGQAVDIRALTNFSLEEWTRGLHDWVRTRGHVQLKPCAFCGSTTRAHLQLLEADGYLCLECRRDRAGVRWSATEFDHFIAFPDLWAKAGIEIQKFADADADSSPMRRSREWRAPRLDTLSNEAVTALIQDYQDGQHIRAIVHEYGLKDVHDVYALLARQGIPMRMKR